MNVKQFFFADMSAMHQLADNTYIKKIISQKCDIWAKKVEFLWLSIFFSTLFISAIFQEHIIMTDMTFGTY